jgi:hypothetical protein
MADEVLDPFEASYVPRLVFEGDDKLITGFMMAAPHHPALKLGGTEYVDATEVFDKVDMLLRVPHHFGFKGTLILYAWGCEDFFKNPPAAMARIFKDAIAIYGGLYERIIFVIQDPDVFQSFNDVFFS